MTEPATDRRRAFTILFVSLMCMGAGQSVMFAILPTLTRRLHLSEFAGSLPFVVSATIWMFTAGYLGGRSDHWKSRTAGVRSLEGARAKHRRR